MLYVAQATVLSFSFAKIESAKQQNISSQLSICLIEGLGELLKRLRNALAKQK